MTFEVVVFDWDGTLVDSEQHIVSSIEFAASKLGLPELSYDEMKDIIGLGMQEALQKLYPGLDDDGIAALRAHYSSAFFSKQASPASLFSGVKDALEGLRSRKVNMAVATGKSRRGLERALDATQLRPYFDIERCADETRSKPDPLMLQELCEYFSLPPEKMLMVGDTEYDLHMAQNIGMPAVGVSYGVHDVSRLQKYKPLKIVDNLTEVLTLI